MKYKKVALLFMIIVLLTVQFSAICLPASAAPTKPTLCGIPKNNQIVPKKDVVLRWNDSPNEAYYYMTIRNVNTNALIYNKYVVAQNSTSFTVPKSVLTFNTEYRWCVAAVDSSGTYKCADAVVFFTEKKFVSNEETGVYIAQNDPHLYAGGFASTNNIEYFVYATETYNSVSYDSILNSAAQSWNNISSNVRLTRTGSPTDGKYEMGIYQTPAPANDSISFGTTIVKAGGMNGTVVTPYDTYDYAEIRTYHTNVNNVYSTNQYITEGFYITNLNTYLKANAMHEIGHALSLIHTDIYDSSITVNTNINKTKNTNEFVPLIMNQGEGVSDVITEVDKSHLRLKWN